MQIVANCAEERSEVDGSSELLRGAVVQMTAKPARAHSMESHSTTRQIPVCGCAGQRSSRLNMKSGTDPVDAWGHGATVETPLLARETV